jgi:hypothetical protein
MSVEERRALVERVVEAVWNRGELAVVDGLFAPMCWPFTPSGLIL